MREDLRELYQAVILDHARAPRNFRRPERPSRQAHGHNPMCGDQVSVYLSLDEGGLIEDAAFEGKGCAISLASASLMTETLPGRSAEDALRLLAAFEVLCSKEPTADGQTGAEQDRQVLERLRALAGVRAFPARIRCATLAWQTMAAALRGDGETSSE
jgi:nitrogen fixation protein NifU and related proteins